MRKDKHLEIWVNVWNFKDKEAHVQARQGARQATGSDTWCEHSRDGTGPTVITPSNMHGPQQLLSKCLHMRNVSRWMS